MIPPKPGLSAGQRTAAIVALGAVVAASVAYTIFASRAAIQESRGDGTILAQRNAERKIGIFYPSYTFNRQPNVACNPDVLQTVNDAVDTSFSDPRAALAALDTALTRDPHCVPAARVLSILAARVSGPKGVMRLKHRLLDPADKDPNDAPAQLMAAYYARELGDGEGYRKYLERTERADAAQPLLDNAWASYWDLFAQPRDFQQELFHTRQEIERTSDLGTLSNLAGVYFQVEDYERAAQTCSRYGASVSLDRWDTGLLSTCLRASLAIGDKAAEAKYVKQFLADNHDAACAHRDLASNYASYTCRTEDALREVNLAIDEGCGEPAIDARRGLLIRLHRYEEAAEPPLGGQYWTGRFGEAYYNPKASNHDRDGRALALGMLGRDQEARDLLLPVADRDERAQILLGMIDQGVLRKRVESSNGCGLRTERSELLAGTAGAYTKWQLFDEGKPLLDEAFALNPKSPAAWADRVYLASIQGNLQEAAQVGEQALGLGIDDPYLAGNLGYVYQQLGRCDKAIPLFERKLEGEPWTVPNYTNLAKCYEAVGRDREAAAMWAYVQGGRPRAFWWIYALIVVAAVGLYLGTKFALIKLAPARFGHLKFP